MDRFAAAGFVALARDLYDGQITDSPDEAGRLMMALEIDSAERNLRGAVDYLLSRQAWPVALSAPSGSAWAVSCRCMPRVQTRRSEHALISTEFTPMSSRTLIVSRRRHLGSLRRRTAL